MSRDASPSAVSVDGYSDGHGRGLIGIRGMWQTWHAFRILVALVAMAGGLGLGVLWRWPGGFAAAVLGLAGLVDALLRIRSEAGSPIPSLLLDTTLIGLAMVVVGLQPEGMAAPVVYMIAVPLVLLPWLGALPVIAYAVAWTAAAMATTHAIAMPVDVSDRVVSAIAFLTFAVPTLGLLGVISFQFERSYLHRIRRVRYEHALAACGEALLASPEDGAIDTALAALLEATPAQNIFVDENFDDPIVGLSCRVAHDAIRPGSERLVSEEIWFEPEDPTYVLRTELPYADMPTLHEALSNGEIAVVHTAQLEGREREIYEDDGCKSELNIPITVYGEWVGSIGFADYEVDRNWNDDDLRVLRTAAAMIGSFWERARATRALEDLVYSKTEFLASISHEIRTPLTAVLGFSEVLREDPGDLGPGGAEMIGLVAEQAQEISDIVEDLLVAARADMNALNVGRAPVVLLDEAKHVVAARGSRTPIHLDSEGSDVVAMADGARVRQIIRCLLSNAARYGGDRIEIKVGRSRGRATLTVSDDGPGVPAGHEGHIFEAFHRARDDDGKTQAVGLGLYVAYHLARLMGGNLSYQRPQGWTRFELELPDAAGQLDVPFLSDVGSGEPTHTSSTTSDTLAPSP